MYIVGAEEANGEKRNFRAFDLALPFKNIVGQTQ
jgi:hypothetical protein